MTADHHTYWHVAYAMITPHAHGLNDIVIQMPPTSRKNPVLLQQLKEIICAQPHVQRLTPHVHVVLQSVMELEDGDGFRDFDGAREGPFEDDPEFA